MPVEQLVLAVCGLIAVAVAFLVVLGVRQYRQSKRIDTHMEEARSTCARLETRIETVVAECGAEFAGVKTRIARLETGS
jgi:uncharacterized protein YoxC